MHKILISKSKDIRLRVLEKVYKTGKGHIGGTYSIIDILVAMYYGKILKDSDLLLIGKGHACLASYLIWEDLGIIDKKLLDAFGKNGALLGAQFDINTPASKYNTGSLGHVIGIGAGYALGLRLQNNTSRRVFIIVGDGECEEGSIWESIDFAVKNKINNLVIIVDRNRLSVTDFIEDDRLIEKFKAFGANVVEVEGHDFESLLNVFSSIESLEKGKPFVLIANTIKGKGVSFLENNAKWHNGIFSEKQYKQAKEELNG